MGNDMINEIINPIDLINRYCDEGFWEDENNVILVSEGKFRFRCKKTNRIQYISYGNEHGEVVHTENALICINKAQEMGFIIK